MVPGAHLSSQPKRHLDRFSRFCRAHYCDIPINWPRRYCDAAYKRLNRSFGIWTQVEPRKRVLGGIHTVANWRIPVNRPCAAAMRPDIKSLW